MFILTVPMYSRAEINGDSNYVLYAAMIRAMKTIRPDWHFVVLFPDKNSGFKYDADGLFNEPNVTRVAQRISTRKMANAVSYDGSFFDELFRTYGFDIVWCNLVEIAAQLKWAGNAAYDPAGQPRVTASHVYVIHPSLPYIWPPIEHVMWMQLTGALGADLNVFNSDHTRRMVLENAHKYLAPEQAQRIEANGLTIKMGHLDDVTTLPLSTQRNDPPVVVYNHRLQMYKNFKATFDVLNALHTEGVRFKVLVTTSTPDNLAAVRSYPFVEIAMCATRADYLRALQRADLNTTNSVHETFCLSASESMALGQPLVAPNGVTFPEITFKDALNYPFLFDSVDDQKAMLRTLLTSPPLRKKWGKKLSDKVREQFSSLVWAENYAMAWERLHAWELGTPADALAATRTVLTTSNGKPLQEVMRALLTMRVNGRKPFGVQSCPLPKILRLVRHFNGKVVMRNNQQVVLMQ